MAQLAITGSWKSIAALTSFFVLIGLMGYATVTVTSFGVLLYLLAILVIALGFWSKEDMVAMGGIIGISALIILDILLRIGVLSFNHVKVLAGH